MNFIFGYKNICDNGNGYTQQEPNAWDWIGDHYEKKWEKGLSFPLELNDTLYSSRQIKITQAYMKAYPEFECRFYPDIINLILIKTPLSFLLQPRPEAKNVLDYRFEESLLFGKKVNPSL